MPGAKGRSGGARRGAGRPRKSAAVAESLEAQPHGGALKRQKQQSVPIDIGPDEDMLTLLKKIALGQVDASSLQVRAAIAAVQYEHPKAGDGGKKDAKSDAAKKAATGRFAAAPAPLRMVK